jgi:uncharacterized protein (TIGR02271 family)
LSLPSNQPLRPDETDDQALVRDQHLLKEGELVVPLQVEDVVVSRRKVKRSMVRVAVVTRSHEQVVDEDLTHERVAIERMPIGRYVESVPPIRHEGELTIMPVVEEVVVVERKLLLREEVHIRRIRTTEKHVETVQLREQDAIVTRLPAANRDDEPTSS